MKNCIYFLLLILGSCIDPYRPPEIAEPASYLVVNGYFNSTPGTVSTIQLTRTQNLNATKAPIAETRATVSIESKSKAVYALREGTNGNYTLTGVTPQPGETYRLRIRTSRGVEYFSEYVPVIPTPPIDSVTWRVENDGVQIRVNTHDPTNNTRHYRWDYESAWEYVAPYFSSLELKSNQVVDRVVPIYRCWGSEVSTNIIATNTTRLSKDVVSQYPIAFIPNTSFKLNIKYSILVRQIGLTSSGFAYYDQLGKITQNIGSLFDPQPSQVTGNIICPANPAELVMGFFRVGTVQTKRIFIRSSQLPNWPNGPNFSACTVDTMTLAQVRQSQPYIITLNPETGRYMTTSIECVDCRTKGGVLQKPDFWE